MLKVRWTHQNLATLLGEKSSERRKLQQKINAVSADQDEVSAACHVPRERINSLIEYAKTLDPPHEVSYVPTGDDEATIIVSFKF